MGVFEDAIATALENGFAKIVQPLAEEVRELRKILENQSAPHDEWVKQNELPEKLGSLGLTKFRKFMQLPNAPMANALGLYSVKEWREFIDNLPKNKQT